MGNAFENLYAAFLTHNPDQALNVEEEFLLLLQLLTGAKRDRLLQDGPRDGRGSTVPIILFRDY